MNPSDIFAHMADNFQADKASGVEATVQFNLSGDNGGSWHVVVANGECEVNEGAIEGATATVSMTDEDYVAMTTGKLNAMGAFMSGKIQVAGDLNAVMKFQQVFPV